MAKKPRAAKKKPAGKRKPARKARPRRPVKSVHFERRSFDQGMEKFGQEMGKLGDRFGKHMERKGKEWEAGGKELETGWNRTLGATGPFFSSVFGIIVLAIMLWIFSFFSVPLGSGFLAALYGFLVSNLALFFAFFLFFAYTSYFRKHFRRAYLPISPIVIAIGITIGFWLLMSALDLINISFANIYLTNVAMFIQYNLFGIFIGFLFLGYLVLFIGMITGRFECHGIHYTHHSHHMEAGEAEMAGKKKSRVQRVPGVSGVKRLYRSGKDKILGGVCGGIAEYLGVDPVLIRLIWVVFALGWGTGILAYIIAWIIIPRNPRDTRHWD